MIRRDVEPYNTIIKEIVKNEKKEDLAINGKYILDIYNSLSDADKISLIRAIYKHNVNNEINDIEQINAVETAKLKTWAIKSTAVIFFISMLGLAIAVFLLSSDFFISNNSLSALQKIYDAIFSE